jgi:hypothetical protein
MFNKIIAWVVLIIGILFVLQAVAGSIFLIINSIGLHRTYWTWYGVLPVYLSKAVLCLDFSNILYFRKCKYSWHYIIALLFLFMLIEVTFLYFKGNLIGVNLSFELPFFAKMLALFLGIFASYRFLIYRIMPIFRGIF